MWESIINSFVSSIASAFAWFESLISAIPGAWETALTFFVIFIVFRFLLAPVIGGAFRAGKSDSARKSKNNGEGG